MPIEELHIQSREGRGEDEGEEDRREVRIDEVRGGADKRMLRKISYKKYAKK